MPLSPTGYCCGDMVCSPWTPLWCRPCNPPGAPGAATAAPRGRTPCQGAHLPRAPALLALQTACPHHRTGRPVERRSCSVCPLAGPLPWALRPCQPAHGHRCGQRRPLVRHFFLRGRPGLCSQPSVIAVLGTANIDGHAPDLSDVLADERWAAPPQANLLQVSGNLIVDSGARAHVGVQASPPPHPGVQLRKSLGFLFRRQHARGHPGTYWWGQRTKTFFAHGTFFRSHAVPVPGPPHSWHAADEWRIGRGIGNDVTQQRRVAVEVGRASKKERQHAGSQSTCACEGQEVGPAQCEFSRSKTGSHILWPLGSAANTHVKFLFVRSHERAHPPPGKITP